MRTIFINSHVISSNILWIKVLMINKSLYYKGFLMIQKDIVKFIFSTINDKKRKNLEQLKSFTVILYLSFDTNIVLNNIE